MNYWILPSNEDTFRLSDFLKVSRLVDWRQHNNFEIGDIIFIYNSRPHHKITFKMVVERVNIPSSEYLNDRMFWKNIKECEDGLKQNRYVRMRLIAAAPDNSKLDLDSLRKKGLKGNLQSAIKVSDADLLYYIRTKIQPDTEDKIARICWNTNGWEYPSGMEGKSKSQSYEAENGFGHEEWLLDRRKVSSDGYHYGFLEPLRKSSFDGKKNIHLYSITPIGKKLYVGCIQGAIYVSPEESKIVWEQYKSSGWLDSMVEELKGLGLEYSGLDEPFNVKFRFEDYIDYQGNEMYISKDDPNTTNHRYVFLNKREPLMFESQDIDLDSEIISDPNDKIPEGAKSRVTVNRYERNPKARAKCLAAKGCSCSVCGMNFEKVYGEIGKNFIHIHHIVPISEIGQTYIIDPVKDLVPVCPNCHAMLHQGKNGKVLTVEELKKMVGH